MQLQLAERYGGIDAWGNPMMDPHYAAAWAWAGNTPFQWGKQVGSHLGGTRNPLVVHWPERITEPGALRTHFTHAIDIGPTILDITGIPMPTHIDGIEQQPMHGVTFADSLTDANAPERHTQQYFETIGNRSMYKHGWWLSMKTARIPWVLTPEAIKPYAPGVWNPETIRPSCTTCPTTSPRRMISQRRHPEKVKELQELFWQEAEKYKVLPLMAPLAGFFGMLPPLPETAHVRVSRRRAERSLRDDPADLQPLVHDHRRAHDPTRRRRRGGRRRSRPPGRILAVRRRRQDDPHLLDDGRVRVPPAGRRIASRRRGDGPDAVRRRRGQAGDRRRGHAVDQSDQEIGIHRWCCARDGGLLALRRRPCGGGRQTTRCCVG